jgi:phosphoenolpyruvate carboxylase
MATPEIARQQIDKIQQSAAKGLAKNSSSELNPALEAFAELVSNHYRASVTSDEFLKMVEAATPYSYLSYLKIGSRPSKRSAQLSVKGLRAIPWILCWTPNPRPLSDLVGRGHGLGERRSATKEVFERSLPQQSSIHFVYQSSELHFGEGRTFGLSHVSRSKRSSVCSDSKKPVLNLKKS